MDDGSSSVRQHFLHHKQAQLHAFCFVVVLVFDVVDATMIFAFRIDHRAGVSVFDYPVYQVKVQITRNFPPDAVLLVYERLVRLDKLLVVIELCMVLQNLIKFLCNFADLSVVMRAIRKRWPLDFG